MKVFELIEALKKIEDQNLDVIVYGESELANNVVEEEDEDYRWVVIEHS